MSSYNRRRTQSVSTTRQGGRQRRQSTVSTLPHLERIASFVPQPVRRILAESGEALSKHQIQSVKGCVLFADISGYTALTEQCAKAGPAGAEKIRYVLNEYFGLQSKIISEHGGDVIRYCGDGLLAIWPTKTSTRDETLAQVCLRTVNCSLELLNQLKTHDWGQKEVELLENLKSHIGVGCGELVMTIVGGKLGWEFLVGGETLQQVGVVDLAKPGEMVVSKRCWRFVDPYCVGRVLQGGSVHVTECNIGELKLESCITPITMEMFVPVRSYVPQRIIRLLDAGHYIAELRRITVLFVLIQGLHYGTECLEAIQDTFVNLQTIVAKYEGVIKEFSVDDKGNVMVAGFGLPPKAHEDDSSRAVAAAFDIINELNEKGLRVDIGIATGQIFCGSVGGDTKREYAVIGDTVNLSARLMMKAKERDLHVLCDDYTYNEMHNSTKYEFQHLDQMKLKGKAKMVSTHCPYPKAEKTTDMNRAEFTQSIVGREEEREHLHRKLFEMVNGGNGAVVIIEGEAGIGKTTMVDEVREKRKRERVKMRTLV
eukprot:TRINITY_DN3140_c0_g1_i6.p1 TRINITY_DN3140_c0_g1~~TRINITY_DN3140_c0_g1_i6.p1  ORF type:complete len:540 (-),score=144.56 TRINITY_DN3140_c0_g1_i6:68-1687(-)